MDHHVDPSGVLDVAKLSDALIVGQRNNRIVELWLVRHKGVAQWGAIERRLNLKHEPTVITNLPTVQIERLVATWEQVRATRSRLKKVEAVRVLLADTPLENVPTIVSYLSGELPQGRIGMGYAAVGSVAANPTSTSMLAVSDIASTLTAIKAATGPGSKKAKAQLLHDLLTNATAPEQDFLRRLLVGELRQGALEGIMMDAVAAAAQIEAPLVRRAAMVTGDLAMIAGHALKGGSEALSEFGLELFTAVQPMLAQTAENVPAALIKTGEAAVEWKVDGARVQVHRRGDELRVFTRNLRDITSSAPEVIRAVAGLDVDSIILDGEAVARRADDRPVAFQETMSRFSSDGDGSLSVVFFDCLHLNGRDLIDLSGSERWAAMQTALPPELLIQRQVTSDPAAGQAFFEQAIHEGYEGVMVKALDSTYDAGRRGAGWLKVKPVHTLDLVVLAVEWGSGRRNGWLSNIHLGARDPDNDGQFVMLGKTFKGMTDDMLRWQTERFLALESHRDGHIVHLRPEQVVEIAVDGIQRSTRYPGGVALRFARVKRYRDDKPATEADTLAAVKALGH
ncbi:UNVERIFIED_CONTAM: hypothetical protein GTU68_043024 [Idotea baltica]|nr:hypothetical protein [Idotea baltica]